MYSGKLISRYLLCLFCCLLVLSSCTTSNQPLAKGKTSPKRTPVSTLKPTNNLLSPTPTTESLASLIQTEQLLEHASHPGHDLYSLVQRLKLHTSTAIAPVVRITPLNARLGQENLFWISNQDTLHYNRIRAKLVYITPHVYMYVEDGLLANLAALQASANVFETKIYPTDRALFGSEWSPGIDGDVHLTMLNVVGLGQTVGGYFSSKDEYPVPINAFSNEREMFYINLDQTIPGSADYSSMLAHEFQRMIHWYHHPVDLNWTDEGMAMLAQHLNGFSVLGVDRSFIQDPNTQLTDWPENPNAVLSHFGAAYLFLD